MYHSKNERFEEFKGAYKRLCDNIECNDCPLNIQVMHDGTLKDLCDLISKSEMEVEND